MKLTIRDPYKPRRPQVIDDVQITRAVVTKRGTPDARTDRYAVIFRSLDGRQFALSGTGLELGDLVQAVCRASETR